MSLNATSVNSNKRQRSQESRNEVSRPPSSGNGQHSASSNGHHAILDNVKLPAFLRKTKAEIQSSFQDLEWKQRYRMVGAMQNANSPFRLDRSAIVVSRNRYGNVQPWDNTRIKLSTSFHGSDYINASPIKLQSLRSSSGERGRTTRAGAKTNATFPESRYIATQGPKSDQSSQFWHMVMQQSIGEVGVVIMLTQCYEGLREKCSQYFPPDEENATLELLPEPKEKQTAAVSSDDGDPFLDLERSSADTDTSPDTTINTEPSSSQPDSTELTESGRVELIDIAQDSSIGCEVRKLKLTIGDNSKVIYHYFYGNWPDFGKPEAEDRVALLHLMRVSKRVAGESPRIVHCSAGVGRTGTWIALDFLLRELEEGRLVDNGAETSPGKSQTPEQTKPKETWGKSGPAKTTTPEPKESDIVHDTVDRLRIQRMMMVMNEVQYSFLYETLKEAFLEKYAQKQQGAVVTGAIQEPSPKIAKTNSTGKDYDVSYATQPRTEEYVLSEAETEIEGEGSQGSEKDPYSAVAPANIREGIEKGG